MIFEPVTEEILRKFPDKRSELVGYKYKMFDIEEFKGMLSMPSKDEINRSQNRKKTKNDASSEPKFSVKRQSRRNTRCSLISRRMFWLLSRTKSMR